MSWTEIAVGATASVFGCVYVGSNLLQYAVGRSVVNEEGKRGFLRTEELWEKYETRLKNERPFLYYFNWLGRRATKKYFVLD